MNDGTRGRPELRRMRWPRMGLLAIVASSALLAAACSGSPSAGSSGGSPAGGSTSSSPGSTSSSPDPGGSSSAGRSATQQKQLAYSECMRAHGVPDVPTSMPSVEPGSVPSSNTPHWSGVSASGPNPGSPQFEAAQQACHSPYSNGGSQPG
jgi:hypothetical protein